MKRIYITRRIPESGINLLKEKGYQIDINTKPRPLTQNELAAALKKKPYDAVLSLLTDKIDAKIFKAAPQVKIFANFAIGFDNFDLEEAKKRGVFLTNAPGGGAETVAEHTVGLMLSLGRKINESDTFIKKGKYKGWDPMLFQGMDLKGKTLGIIGTGKIGSETAKICMHGLGMNVIYYDVVRNPALEKEIGATFYSTIDDVIAKADIVSLHVPLLPSTHHLMDKTRIKKMKPTAFLINCARGPVIDEKALVTALQKKHIAGAALDVFEFEPKLSAGLTKLPNVILTPHTASSTKESRDDMATKAANNIISVLENGKPISPVY